MRSRVDPSSFEIKTSKTWKISSIDELEKEVEMKWNKLRIHYFFTENYSIEDFINETKVEFRLTNGENWKDIIANGILDLHLVDRDIKNDPFFKFDKENAHVVKMETINVYMHWLSVDIKPFYLKTKAGYKFDQEIQTEKLDLWKYNSVFTNDWYFNSNPLPIEWLEMFEIKENLGKIVYLLER